MTKCPVCKADLQNFNEEIMQHLIVLKGVNGHNHIHGPIENKALMKEFTQEILTHAQLSDSFKETAYSMKDRKEVVFHNRQRLGDILMFTAGVRDFKAAFPNVKVNVISTAPHIWDNNPNIDRALVPNDQNTIKIGPGWLTNASNRVDWHFANAYRISIEQALNINIPQGVSRPDIWLTEEEFNAPPVTKEPYWLIVVSGEKGWGCKMYPFERWQEFVNQNPGTLFYQLGAKEDDPPRLRGNNVVDYVGKTQDKNTGIRDLFKLFLNAEGSIGLVSFHMHLSGALYKPSIVIAGAREPVSFTRYQGHQYLSTEGCLPCSAAGACWHCDINTCSNLAIGKEKVPKCVDIIYPEDLTRALNQYYVGGRLEKGRQSEKPKQFKNIVKSAVNIFVPKAKEVESNVKEKTLQDRDEELRRFRGQFGYQFDSGSIHCKDWEFIEKAITENNVKSVLEFGCGLSSLLLNKKGLRVVSYDTNPKWIDRVKGINPDLDIRLWDGQAVSDMKEGEHFDIAFVDGPSGGKMREFSTKIASELSDLVLVHDAWGEDDRLWQDKYIIEKFTGPEKGGRWNGMYLWKKKPDFSKTAQDFGAAARKSLNIAKESVRSKTVKLVSTARGWGGCARSITTIMKHLLKAGHKVEFIPFRNSVGSHEFRDCLENELRDVKVTLDYETLHESCDVMLVYADDYVWEFGKPAIVDAFSTLNAGKKIMMLNYRRGNVGEIGWTRMFDKYMFLNSGQEKELLKVLPGVETKVLPPCTELDVFLKVQPNYNNNLRIVRHSSQGDTKFDASIAQEVDSMVSVRADIHFDMLPGPSFISTRNNFVKHPRTDNPAVIADLLSKGNLFWYSLPYGYLDMGPRVILEAMAAGLPILADNWGGAIDRVTPDCGWLCDTKVEHLEVVKNVSFAELKKKGNAARERAITEFIPEKWIKEIIC